MSIDFMQGNAICLLPNALIATVLFVIFFTYRKGYYIALCAVREWRMESLKNNLHSMNMPIILAKALFHP